MEKRPRLFRRDPKFELAWAQPLRPLLPGTQSPQVSLQLWRMGQMKARGHPIKWLEPSGWRVLCVDVVPYDLDLIPSTVVGIKAACRSQRASTCERRLKSASGQLCRR